MWEAAGIVKLSLQNFSSKYSPMVHERNALFGDKKWLPKNDPMHLNQQLVTQLEDFCTKLLGNTTA